MQPTLKRDVITAVGDNLHLLNLSNENQPSDENLGIGTRTWTDLVELEAEHDLKPFFSAVRKFYVATINKMLQKFPFGDSLLKDLGILQPEKTASYSFDRVQYLAEGFLQLGLADVSIDQFREEFMDFTLSPLDLPSVSEYKAADDTLKARVGLFWSKVGKIRTLDGQERFGLLCKLMYGLLSIPCSNADSERGFSILRKIHTDQRSNLDQSTIITLMSIKFNSDNCCYDIELCEDLLSQCKHGT